MGSVSLRARQTNVGLYGRILGWLGMCCWGAGHCRVETGVACTCGPKCNADWVETCFKLVVVGIAPRY